MSDRKLDDDYDDPIYRSRNGRDINLDTFTTGYSSSYGDFGYKLHNLRRRIENLFDDIEDQLIDHDYGM